MQIVTKDIVLQNETLTLTNQRVVFWKAQNTLILSDIHIGKSAHFRKAGIPISDAVLQTDLNRLKQLITHFNTKTLLVVGDLFHAGVNSDIETFKQWLQQFNNLILELVVGNHDRLSETIYNNLEIKVFKTEKKQIPFTFIHDNAIPKTNQYIISGHTHPGVVLKGRGRQKIKLPCYQITKQQLILPAFSLFTGLNINNSTLNCINYAFTDSDIFEIK